ncbi:FMN-binding negative transcriptional regulator [Cupriavidus basilensis]|uniref:FMN-binding negative transcriptional regulator n=1 Tax=Cupriavidus basilensis TaxID=68895 RepID=A0ABT6AVA9_9BURK|nr:FMN-binding negative transcriptional regulator [Cupriavidus basilensis]MDF3836567.1 FMN-binding negative transcriptional regulator [Cupriavidus basilensis]
MYTPTHFACTENDAIDEVMRRYPFATLIGNDAGGLPFATHLPVVAERSGDSWRIEAHMARANPHWRWLEQTPKALLVFQGPHGYVSPALYEEKRSVPTWNYVAVHVYAEIVTVHDAGAKDALLKRLIAHNEPGYAAQWHDLPEDFKQKMLGGIVGLRIEPTRIEAKFKLSQNRPATDRARILAAQREGSAIERDMAEWMARMTGA